MKQYIQTFKIAAVLALQLPLALFAQQPVSTIFTSAEYPRAGFDNRVMEGDNVAFMELIGSEGARMQVYDGHETTPVSEFGNFISTSAGMSQGMVYWIESPGSGYRAVKQYNTFTQATVDISVGAPYMGRLAVDAGKACWLQGVSSSDNDVMCFNGASVDTISFNGGPKQQLLMKDYTTAWIEQSGETGFSKIVLWNGDALLTALQTNANIRIQDLNCHNGELFWITSDYYTGIYDLYTWTEGGGEPELLLSDTRRKNSLMVDDGLMVWEESFEDYTLPRWLIAYEDGEQNVLSEKWHDSDLIGTGKGSGNGFPKISNGVVTWVEGWPESKIYIYENGETRLFSDWPKCSAPKYSYGNISWIQQDDAGNNSIMITALHDLKFGRLYNPKYVTSNNEQILMGDVDADGDVDIVDALKVAQYSVGVPVPGFHPAAADVNENGVIGYDDANIIAAYQVGDASVLDYFSVSLD